jgi:hypothetical protein
VKSFTTSQRDAKGNSDNKSRYLKQKKERKIEKNKKGKGS